MWVVRCAAGIGQRLDGASLPLKVPLRFGGETLIVCRAVSLCHCGAERIDRIHTGRTSRAAQPGARA